MIILGWIGFFLLFVSIVGALSKSKYETFLQSCVGVVAAMLTAIAVIGGLFGVAYLVISLLIATFGGCYCRLSSSYSATITPLHCSRIY
jgi:hypothetical protein